MKIKSWELKINMRILITEPKDYSPKAIAMYRSLGHVYFLPQLKGKKKKEILTTAAILVVRLRHAINASWMDRMPNLKIIATNTTGLNHIDTIEARKRGIRVISLRGETGFLKNIPSTAEETMALMLALVRHIPWAHAHVLDEKGWDREKFRGHQLLGKTLGIIGFGRLGKIVARYAAAFGMGVIAYDPHIPASSFGKVKNVSLQKLCGLADVVSLHASFDPERPRVIFGEKQLRQMKPTAYFINTARGELVNEKALARALQKKWIKGAALDVLWDERGDGGHLRTSPLVAYAKKNKNLIIVPHLGGATFEAMQITEEFIADLVKREIKRR